MGREDCKSPNIYYVPIVDKQYSKHSISHGGEYLPEITQIHVSY